MMAIVLGFILATPMVYGSFDGRIVTDEYYRKIMGAEGDGRLLS
jgi:hypothetical protein